MANQETQNTTNDVDPASVDRVVLPPFNRLAELANGLPRGLRSDWDGTNHYELTCNGEDYWWLFLTDGLREIDNPMESVEGKRFGLLMDIAEEVARLRDEGFLGR